MSSEEINYSIGHTIAATANTSGEYNLHTVTAAKQLTIKRVTVHLPAGSEYQLQIALLRGTEQRIPDSGYIAGDDQKITVECNVTYRSGETIKVWYNNTDTANDHSCYVLVEGEIE